MPRPRTLLRVLLFAVVLAFVVWTARDLAARWQDSPNVEVSIGWLAASLLPIVGVSLCQGFAWVSLVRHLARAPVPMHPGLELLMASMLGRYAPAKVGMAAVLITSAKRLGQPASLLVSAMVIQAMVYTLLGLGMGVAALSWSRGALPQAVAPLSSSLGIAALAGLALVTAASLVVDRRRYPAKIRERLGVGGEGPLVNVAHVVWLVVVWLGWWLHGWMVVLSVGGTSSAGVELAGFFVLAPVVGFVALVSPGGLGVREAIIAVGLTPVLGSAAATVSAIVARAASLGVDLAMWAAFRLTRRSDTSETNPDEAPVGEAPVGEAPAGES